MIHGFMSRSDFDRSRGDAALCEIQDPARCGRVETRRPAGRKARSENPMRMLGTANLDLLEQLFDRLPTSPFFVKDAELRYVAANPPMARLCGAPNPGALIGKSARDIFPIGSAERYEALDRRILAGGRPVRDRLELVPGHDQMRTWLLFSRFPVTDPDGKIVGVAATSRNLPAPERQHPVYSRLVEVVRHIRTHFDAPLEVNEIARKAGISKSQLERDFSRIFGSTMQAFLHSARMEYAIQALEGRTTIAQIAMDCGYSDHSAFTRRFHAVVGLAPREYRRRVWGSEVMWRPGQPGDGGRIRAL